MQALLHSVPQTLQQATADPRLRRRLLDTHRQVWVSLLWGHCSLLLGPSAHKVLSVPLKSFISPVLCKFWQLYGRVNGDLLQQGSCHTQVCCTQSPSPCGSPLLTRQTQFCLSLFGVSGSWCTQGLFEFSEWFWWEWALILNMNSPLLPSCWGFSFAIGRGISPQSCSSTVQLQLQVCRKGIFEKSNFMCGQDV